ncbi:MAG: AAA family ATPase [Eubacterium sp.]|nr:AAA family ATPase [Eubacterium sp.]
MNRTIMKDLVSWKNKSNRKPLILQGARQVGKTWIMKEFGRQNYKYVAYVNMDHNAHMQESFTKDIIIYISSESLLLGREIS